ncbi:beta-ketoacyl synthase N-terminal-like domain-containing protein [Streptomyces sp. CT34]|uniref:beta-ketoacyl synthase N-terminal-like domain-containing protein n=1 Tax=Streptomyces sp. CT34 TaxID=1553907 RepID=UPI0007C77AAA|nr:beta-ketoacyl synthase N-terminal-like domain-containing protein [Streptomyces sp. CT34]
MSFQPIAIVGRGCVLPDALDPDTFWDNIAEGRCSLSPVRDGRWRLSHRWAMGTVEDHLDRTWTDVGGYVQDFEREFDPAGFLVDPGEILALDPLFQWVLHGTRQALREAGRDGPLHRAGLVLGNLSYPTSAGAAFAEHVLLSSGDPMLLNAAHRTPPDARNRFSSGLPAHFTARALGLGAGAFALDAACASSLYAIKLACDRLHDGTADLMVAGAVNRVDNLFLHVGLCGLSAVSRSSRSRPFHREADGLLHGEGAGFVALMRLSDALAADSPVLGVIRGVGLSNDGRGRGLLTPAEEGQEQAMRLAYSQADVAPETVSLLECHATGTPIGDATEVRSTATVFADSTDLPIGSVKSNIGHLLAPAGASGLLKVLGAMRAGIRPATLAAADPLDELTGTPLRVLNESEPWQGLRRAAVSAFGFGGTNAHLIVDAWDADSGAVLPAPSTTKAPNAEVAIVAIGARVGDGAGAEDFRRAVLGGRRCGPATTVNVALPGLSFPPRAVERTLPQQLQILEAAREAVRDVDLPRERTMVLVGMGVDPQIARANARLLAPQWLEEAGSPADSQMVERVRNALAPPLEPERVVGSLPNLIANRINTQLDLAGPGFTVSAEEASGLVALDLAARALRTGEVDAALVGAVDLVRDPVHEAALTGLGHEADTGDAAVAMVLKRLSDARRDGDAVLSVLDDDTVAEPGLIIGDGADYDPTDLVGRAHAAHGLLCVAVGATALCHRARPQTAAPARIEPGLNTAEIVVTPIEAPPVRIRLRSGDTVPWASGAAPRLHVYSGRDRREILAALDEDTESSDGPARLTLVSEGDSAAHRNAARRWLADGGARPSGVFYRDTPVTGELAFVYTNGSAAYQGMGRELLLALPTLASGHARAWPRADAAPSVLDQMWGAAALATVHTELTRGLLRLSPDAAIGYSSGESAALAALGAWRDVEELYQDSRASSLFTTELTGALHAVRRAWDRLGVHGDRWSSYLVNAPLERVRAALANEAVVHLMAINAPDVCVIGGEARACAAVVARLGATAALPIDYQLAAHAPELAEVRDQSRRLHLRPTTEVPGVRFYSGSSTRPYIVTAERVADAITAQGLGTIDFAGTIERAWADGVRVFVEHGPRGLCTGWIKRILGDREHIAVALDASEGSGLQQPCLAIAELVAAGVPVHAEAFFDQLQAARPDTAETGPTIALPAHWDVVLPSLAQPAEIMPKAPRLTPAPLHEPAPPVVVEVPTQPVSAATPLPTDVRTLIAQQSHRVIALHHDVLAQHVQTHQRFLHARAQLLASMARVARAGRAPMPSTGFLPPPRPPLSPPPVASPSQLPLPGPKFDRAQLEYLAAQRISTLFGPRFAAQDQHAVQTRMPEPPMLLVDRVTGIDARPAALAELGPAHATGTIWTETDVRLDSWYLDATGRIPAGLMIEAGQADLLLISWLGIDLINRGERAYRLLGCELTYHGSPPEAGETLRYEIRIDRHAEHDGVRLFFFRYDCYVGDELRLSVRNGQAGFFTRAELAGTEGLRWDPAECAPLPELPLDAPVQRCTRLSFTAEHVRAFAAGRPADCFGPGWDLTRAHVRSPRIDGGRLLLLSEVTEFDPVGGPWGRGYLRAQTPVSPDDWFFDGHFKNDPCMPGTLMLQGGLQVMAFYLAALGCTIDRDGWRFEAVDGQPFHVRCRGQVGPGSRKVVYEVFVHGVSTGPVPTLHADILGTVDGVKAFHGHHIALRLVPDWPLPYWRQLGGRIEQTSGIPVPLATLGGLADCHEPAAVVAQNDGFPFDYPSLLACAWGKPSAMFGAMYAPFDSTRKVARLPGPPYHFMTRIVSVTGPQGGIQQGSRVVAEYEVPEQAWYFEQNHSAVMPLAVLMEIALQPCGWLASYVGSALTTESELLFRNLDGSGTVTGEVTPATRTVRTHAELTHISRIGEVIIESFTVRCTADNDELFTLSTVCGFFPPSAFENQPGLSASETERDRLTAPSDFAVDLTTRPARYFTGAACLPGPMLLMLDRITGYWPEGGSAGLGLVRSEKDVDAGEWFFTAHFFQDPVQPGSLGIEAMCQLLQFCLIERGLTSDMPHPRFEPVSLDQEMVWKYRGQITPANRLIRVELEILEVGHDTRGCYAVADARLWADETCIYDVHRIGMRVVSGGGPPAVVDHVLDPAVDTWLADHCPTWTDPLLPMMSVVDRLARAAADFTGQDVVAVRDVQLRRWISVSEIIRLRTEAEHGPAGLVVKLLLWREAANAALSRFEEVARAIVLVGTPPARRPHRFAALPDAVAQPDPYTSAELFHGPSFQYLRSLAIGASGSSAVLDANRGSVPRGYLNQGLLDAGVQAIPHQSLWRWAPEICDGKAGIPLRVASLELFDTLPSDGAVEVEARFAGFPAGDGSLPEFDVQFCLGERVVATLRLIDALMPLGPVAAATPVERRAFFSRRSAGRGAGLSRTTNGRTELTAEEAQQLEWIPGMAHVLGLPTGARVGEHVAVIAVKEHVGRLAGVHPCLVYVSADLRSAQVSGQRYAVDVVQEGDRVTVRSTGE